MMMTLLVNETHDPRLKCWVESAHAPGTDFPIQNLPFGVFTRREREASPRVGVAIGDQILDVSVCLREELFDGFAVIAAEACSLPTLNGLLALGRDCWTALRRQISALLRADSPAHRSDPRLGERLLVPMAEADLHLPIAIGDYTDFYASVYHASNVGRMMRPDNPLLPNYKYVPIGYHGRASSVVASGTPVRRPNGQTRRDEAAPPAFGPSQRLDYELEVAGVIGPGSAPGEAIPIAEAEEHLFGLCLLNDWSARDVQRWEYQPLGPFLAKSFATTISSWIVTMEALAPFRCPAFARSEGDPAPLPYLASPEDQARGGLDLTLEVYLRSEQMRAQGTPPVRLSRGNFRDMYWTLAQMVTHHASNGCNLRPGDLLASGTVSGAAKDSRGCLLELTWGGKEPIELPGGETRRFLEDGDVVTMRGYGERDGCARIGFGECRGEVLKAS
jgi:fumarylacetoacetase